MGWLDDLFKGLLGVVMVAGGIVVTGFTGGLAAPLGGILISAGIGVIASVIQQASLPDQDLKFRANRLSPLDDIPVIYGERLVGGVVVDYRVAGNEGANPGEGGDFLWTVLALSHGSSNGQGIHSVGRVYLNGEFAFDATRGQHLGRITQSRVDEDRWGDNVWWSVAYGYADQVVHPDLNDRFPSRWGEDARLGGIAYLVVVLRADEEVFRGLPTITAEVKGVQVWDMRTDTWAYDITETAPAPPDPVVDDTGTLVDPDAPEPLPWVQMSADVCAFEYFDKAHKSVCTSDGPDYPICLSSSEGLSDGDNITGRSLDYVGIRTGDTVKFSVDVKSDTGADRIQSRIAFLTEISTVETHTTGTVQSGDWTTLSMILRIPEGDNSFSRFLETTEFIMYEANLDGTEGWCIRNRRLQNVTAITPGGNPTQPPVRDPRDPSAKVLSTPGRNPVLCAYDMLSARVYGANVPLEERDNFDEWAREADYCDQMIEQPFAPRVEDDLALVGTTEMVRRFTCDAVIDTSEPISTRLITIASATHGQIWYETGMWRMFIRRLAAEDGGDLTLGPSKITDITISEEHVTGEIEWVMPGLKSTHGRQGANSVNCSYIFPFNNWTVETVSWPSIGQDNPYLAEDNEFEAPLGVQLAATTNPYTALRLGSTILKELREADILTVTLPEHFLEFGIGDIVLVDHTLFATPTWFWITNAGILQSGHVQFSLMRYEPTSYEDPELSDVVIPVIDEEIPTQSDQVNPPENLAVSAELTCIDGKVPHARINVEFDATGLESKKLEESFRIRYRFEDDPENPGQYNVVNGWASTAHGEEPEGVIGVWFDLEGPEIEGVLIRVGVTTIDSLNQSSDDVTSQEPWQSSITYDLQLSSNRIAPDLGGINPPQESVSADPEEPIGDHVYVQRSNGVVRIAADMAGIADEGVKLVLYGSGQSGFPINANTWLDESYVDEFEVDTDLGVPGTGNLEKWIFFTFTPPVEAGQEFFYKICGSDCFTNIFIEADSCSPEFSFFYSGVASADASAGYNIVPIGSDGEYCVSGADEIRGQVYDNIDLAVVGLVPGQRVSFCAEGKVGSGGLCAINEAEDFAQMTSGLIGREFFTTDPFGEDSPWEIRSGTESALTWDGAKTRIKWDPTSGGDNLLLRYNAEGCNLSAPQRGMMGWCVLEMSENAVWDQREDQQPGIGCFDQDDWSGYGTWATMQVYFSFGGKMRIGTRVAGVFDGWSPINVASNMKALGFRQEDDSLDNEGCAAGEDYLQIASNASWIGGLFDRCDSRLDDGSHDTFYPVLTSWNNGGSPQDPSYFYEAHYWRGENCTIENLPSNTTVRFEIDARTITGEAGTYNVSADSWEISGQTGDQDFAIGTKWDAGTNRIILKDSGGTEFSRIEPPSGVYGGDLYAYDPTITTDCYATLRLEFLDAGGALISYSQSAGTQNADYTEFKQENITIPAGAAFMRLVQYKLGTDDCDDVCVRNAVVNAGSVAKCGLGIDTFAAGAGTDITDVPEGPDGERPITGDEADNLGEPSDNETPGGREGEENYSSSDGTSDPLIVRFEKLGGGRVRARVYLQASLKSDSGPCDRLTMYAQGLDANYRVLTHSTYGDTQGGTIESCSTDWEEKAMAFYPPVGIHYLKYWEANLDGTVNWSVKDRFIYVGNHQVPFRRPNAPSGQRDAGSTASNVTVDFEGNSSARLSVETDTVIDLVGMYAGSQYTLELINDGTGGHTITIANVEWASGTEPTYSTTADAVNLLHFVRTVDTTYGSLFGSAFSAGSQTVTPFVNLDAVYGGLEPTVMGTIHPPVQDNVNYDGYAPTVILPLVAVENAAVTYTIFEPIVRAGPQPAVNAITLTTFAPAIPVVFAPQTGGISVEGQAPDVLATAQPGAGGADYDGLAPYVSTT